MRYFSVASGIEAATVAWHPLGWEPVGFAQFDPEHDYRRGPDFASALLNIHYPDVPNYGDMTKFQEWPDAAFNVLVGGTPCQSYSVAGLRGGLDDPRGDLMLTYVAIARRYRPEWVVWENVPGVLSDDCGRSFGTLLGLLTGRRVEVPSGGWESAGAVECYKSAYGVAWRILDTQFVRVDGFGRALPQRRRRVFVVGYSGDWRRAAAVLFERSSMSGDSSPRRWAGKEVAGPISASSGKRGGGTEGELGGLIAEVAPPLLSISKNTGGRFPWLDADTALSLIPEVANPLTARMFKGVNTTMDEGQTMVVEPMAFDETQITHPENRSRPRPGQPAPALAAGARPPTVAYMQAVADPLVVNERGTYTHEGSGNFRTRNVLAQMKEAEWKVRLLTPVECERLQGFPDGYTNIPWRGKNGAPDGSRYRVLGNSMSANVMRWLGRRIEMVENICK